MKLNIRRPKKVMVGVRLTQEDKNRLLKIADKEGGSLMETARVLLVMGMDAYNKS